MIRALILSLSALFLGACGGGSDSTTLSPTNPNQLFSLAVLKTGTPNTQVYTSQLKGTVTTPTNTYSANGSYLLSWLTQTTYNGVMANSQDHNSFINYGSGGLYVSVHYRFFLNVSDGTPVGINHPDGSVSCPITSSFALPDTAKIGDSGLYLTANCSNSTTDTVTWEIRDALGGNVYVVLSLTNRDSSTNALKETAEMRIKLDGSGNVVSFELTAAQLNVGVEVAAPAL